MNFVKRLAYFAFMFLIIQVVYWSYLRVLPILLKERIDFMIIGGTSLILLIAVYTINVQARKLDSIQELNPIFYFLEKKLAFKYAAPILFSAAFLLTPTAFVLLASGGISLLQRIWTSWELIDFLLIMPVILFPINLIMLINDGGHLWRGRRILQMSERTGRYIH